jgi:hypothetical protein
MSDGACLFWAIVIIVALVILTILFEGNFFVAVLALLLIGSFLAAWMGWI